MRDFTVSLATILEGIHISLVIFVRGYTCRGDTWRYTYHCDSETGQSRESLVRSVCCRRCILAPIALFLILAGGALARESSSQIQELMTHKRVVAVVISILVA